MSYAIQKGTKNIQIAILLCGVTYWFRASDTYGFYKRLQPGANDNASVCRKLIEAARRVLSKVSIEKIELFNVGLQSEGTRSFRRGGLVNMAKGKKGGI